MVQAVDVGNEEHDDCHDFKQKYRQGNNPDVPETVSVYFFQNFPINRINFRNIFILISHSHTDGIMPVFSVTAVLYGKRLLHLTPQNFIAFIRCFQEGVPECHNY